MGGYGYFLEPCTHYSMTKTKSCKFVTKGCYSLYKLWNMICPEGMLQILKIITNTGVMSHFLNVKNCLMFCGCYWYSNLPNQRHDIHVQSPYYLNWSNIQRNHSDLTCAWISLAQISDSLLCNKHAIPFLL